MTLQREKKTTPVTTADRPTATVVQGDMREVLAGMPECSVDSVVCDPPYELGFMGKSWDAAGIAFDPETWRAVYRVLKPGGHLVAFGGTRTHHRMMVAVEDAGFEIRDMLLWEYGCLSEDTEVLVNGRWERYVRTKVGDHTLAYDTEKAEFSWQPIQEVFVYNYNDTAFRIRSDYTDQIVSRNHRCVVEQSGRTVFQLAEDAARERQATIPVVEDLQDLLAAIPYKESHSSIEEHALCDVSPYRAPEASKTIAKESAQGASREGMPSMRDNVLAVPMSYEEDQNRVLLKSVQRCSTRARTDKAFLQGKRCLDGTEREILSQEDVRREQSSLEGRRHVLPKARQLQTSQACTMSQTLSPDGAQGRLRHGTSFDRSARDESEPASLGSCASPQSRSTGQSNQESSAIREQSGTQTIRASRFTQATLAGITTEHYRGRMWCIRVSTGAFIARRNGQVFITGNSGFPKSLNVSKAIDKALGAERKKKRVSASVVRNPKSIQSGHDIEGGDRPWMRKALEVGYHEVDSDIPATPEAKQWQGWHTGLKPAFEPIVLARKPVSERNVAANVLRWGCGGINVGACRVGTTDNLNGGAYSKNVTPRKQMWGGNPGKAWRRGKAGEYQQPVGRWPANLILSHDPRCICVGTERVKGVQYAAGSPGFGSERDDGYVLGTGAKHAPDTKQEIYACVPGCPVRMLDEQSGKSTSKAGPRNTDRGNATGSVNFLGKKGWKSGAHFGDTGTASRFFYTPKTSTAERVLGCPPGFANRHPTVKPLALMRWLVRLVTPPKGTVLDPFTGSGSTLVAAFLEGFASTGVELEAESVECARGRIAAAEKYGEGLTKLKRVQVKSMRKRLPGVKRGKC